MSRKKVLEGGTKDKIIAAALKIFAEKGYEETTVRMILEEAGAVVGSFYHYFSSKEELFESVIERFLQGHAEQVLTIAHDDTKPFMERIHLVLEKTGQGTLSYFGNLEGNKLHWTTQYALYMRTLQSILPGIQHMIEKALDDGTAKNLLNMDTQTLAVVVLQGIEGILHAKPLDTVEEQQLVQIKKNIVNYVVFILGIERL